MQRNKALISGRDGEIQRVNPVELSTRQWLMKLLYEEISQSLPSVGICLFTIISENLHNSTQSREQIMRMLEPIYEEKIIGHAEIRQIFKASGVGNIAGAIVTEGRMTKDSIVRITRDKEQIYEGPIARYHTVIKKLS